MRDDIIFPELMKTIEIVLNSSKPLPRYMKSERKLLEILENLQEIPEYNNFKQFEGILDVEPFLTTFLISKDYTRILKMINQSTMKLSHTDGYTPLMALICNPNISFYEKNMVVDKLLEAGCNINQKNMWGETALMIAVKRNDRQMIELLLKKGAYPNCSNYLGITPLMVATYNAQLYNIAILFHYGANLGYICAEFDFDVLDIADITQNDAVKELLVDLGN